MLARSVLPIFLLQQLGGANAAGCEGMLNSKVASQFCQNFFDETACSHNGIFFCLWDSDDGCDLKPLSACSLLDDNKDDCNAVDGCYWTEIPVWVWLAINVPVWFLLAGFCLICYHRYAGPSILDLYDRSEDSMTVDDSSQFTEDQEPIPDMFRNPIQASCSKDSTESENSSNGSDVLGMEEAGTVLERDVP